MFGMKQRSCSEAARQYITSNQLASERAPPHKSRPLVSAHYRAHSSAHEYSPHMRTGTGPRARCENSARFAFADTPPFQYIPAVHYLLRSHLLLSQVPFVRQLRALCSHGQWSRLSSSSTILSRLLLLSLRLLLSCSIRLLIIHYTREDVNVSTSLVRNLMPDHCTSKR